MTIADEPTAISHSLHYLFIRCHPETKPKDLRLLFVLRNREASHLTTIRDPERCTPAITGQIEFENLQTDLKSKGALFCVAEREQAYRPVLHTL